ncbi:hypothetical protein [Lentzea sp. E54]|uniref:hypothetical protein n=1 Tax=Lentzea xerophila TaxID=3435883 RepID=UPI003DA3B376
MPAPQPTDPHSQLLQLAGQAPDDWLTVARDTLATGAVDRLREMMSHVNRVLADREPVADEGRFEAPPHRPGAADRAVVAAAAAHPVEACWLTMRDGTAPVYLLQANDHAPMPAITSAVQRALTNARERSPRVEVFGPLTVLPAYHEAALRAATLLWTSAPAAPVRVARTFDGASPKGGPYFSPTRELVVEESERQRLLGFLAGGEVVLSVPDGLDDVVAPGAGKVPCDLRSDGMWVWSEAGRYYLDRHLVAPDPDLAKHAGARRPPDRLTHLDRYRVRAVLAPNREEGPLWRAG